MYTRPPAGRPAARRSATPDASDRLIIEARNLVHRYGDLTAVDDLSFEIRRGEIFGLLGPNGAGKSTTISILSCLMEPTAGRATIDGAEVSPEAGAIKRRIGLAPQDLAIYEELSGRENLRFFGRLYGLSGRHLKERIEATLELVGLRDRGNDQASKYSGGMKRRLNLAAGLLHEPEILVLDEPTVGVDPQSRNHIFENVERLNAAGVTVIYTTHYMEEAQRLCDRVAIIDHGKLVALDSPRALIESLGGGVIQIGVDEVQRQATAAVLEPLESVTSVGAGPDGLLNLETTSAQHALVDVMQALNQRQIQVRSLRILEPNLESVFLRHTGRSLRD